MWRRGSQGGDTLYICERRLSSSWIRGNTCAGAQPTESMLDFFFFLSSLENNAPAWSATLPDWAPCWVSPMWTATRAVAHGDGDGWGCSLFDWCVRIHYGTTRRLNLSSTDAHRAYLVPRCGASQRGPAPAEALLRLHAARFFRDFQNLKSSCEQRLSCRQRQRAGPSTRPARRAGGRRPRRARGAAACSGAAAGRRWRRRRAPCW